MDGREFHLVALVGSLRAGSYNRAIANTLDELAPDHVAVLVLGSMGELPHYDEDVDRSGVPPAVGALGAAIAGADGVVVVTPEYNHSVPGTLKNALDWLSRLASRPLEGKPVAIQTSSIGLLGGVRAQQPLRDALFPMGARVLARPEVVISQVGAKVDAQTGLLKDEDARRAVSRQLLALSRALA